MGEPIKIPKINITQKGVVSFSRISTIVLIFLLYIVADYINSDFKLNFLTDRSYWISTLINLVLVVSIMVIVRAIRRDKKISTSTEITDAMAQIQTGFKVITVNGFSSELDEYLKELNENNKYETFISQVKNKLIRLGDKEKYEEKRQHLNELLKLPKEEVLKLNVRYKKITVSKLFSSVDGKIVNDNEYDLDTYEKQDVVKMVCSKAMLVFLFTAFGGSLFMDFVFGGISTLYGTALKLFSLLLAVNTSMNIADDFVEHNIKTSVNRRLRHLAGFVNNNGRLKELIDKSKQNKQ